MLLFAAGGLFTLLFYTIRRRVLNARSSFTYTHPKTKIARQFGLEARGIFKSTELPGEHLLLLLLCEDDLFFEHYGFNVREILNRIRYAWSDRKLAGGSSIPQQVIKRLFLTRTPRLLRKILEIPYVFFLERNFSKEEILTLYLSNLYFGIDIVGLREAALFYFEKRPEDITLIEALLLFVSIPLPIRTLRTMTVSGKAGNMDFRKVYWKLKDLSRFIYSKRGGTPCDIPNITYEEAKGWMSNFSKYSPESACPSDVERIITLKSLVSLRDFVHTYRSLPTRTLEEVRSCRDTFPCEYREILESGAVHLRTSKPRRTPTAPHCDWNYLIRLAGWHTMILPVWDALSRNEIALPHEAAARFQREVEVRMVRELQNREIIHRIAPDLSKRAPSAVSVKGTALKLLCGAPDSFRDPGDIDLVIHASEYDAVRNIMGEHDFRPLYKLSDSQERKLLSEGEGIAFQNHEGVHIDIHSNLNGPFGPVFEDGFHERNAYELPGGIRTLNPVSSLLFLAVHGLKHRWSRLGWVLSYAALAERDSFDWTEVFKEARVRRILRPVLLANRLAKEFFEISVPQHDEKDFPNLKRVGDSFAFRHFETPFTKLVRDFGRCSRSVDTSKQAFAWMRTRLFRLGSADLAEQPSIVRKMFPILQKGSKFLRNSE